MLFFVFMQKTAYELRISSWGSDVCSSDLFDCTANGADRFGPGKLSARLVWSHLINQFLVEQPGLPKNEIAGEIGAAKDKFSLTLGYDWGNWSAQTLTTYIGKSYLDDQFWGESKVNSISPRRSSSLQDGYTRNEIGRATCRERVWQYV